MILKDINAEISFELWIKPDMGEDALKQGIGYIAPSISGQGYTLRIDKFQWRVLLRDFSNTNDLNFYLKRGSAHLVEVMEIAKDASALIKVIFFNGDLIELGDLDIAIDEHIESTAKKNGLSFTKTEDLASLLADKLLVQANGEYYFFIYAGKSANQDFEDNSSNENKVEVAEELRAFSLCGNNLTIPIEKRQLSKFEQILHASKIIFRDRQKLDASLRLARGRIKFSSTPEQIKALTSGAMSQLTQEAGSYLKQWDKYGAIEGEMLLARAKAIGKINYHSTEQTKKGVKFFASSNSEQLNEGEQLKPRSKEPFKPSFFEQLNEGDQLELTSEEPSYIKNPDISWSEYAKELEEEFADKKKQENKDHQAPVAISVSILDISENYIELDLPSIPDDDKKMFLVLSIAGDKIQIRRRMEARSAILAGRSANPLLGLIIEEGGVLPDVQRVAKLKPLTPFVKNKIFKHSPTLKQREAISMALNTPDIALIQGPPGTGKTTVIAAILERLNEEYDKTKSVKGQILVSGFQHDAVENIVARLSVNSLPAVKFGRRSSDSQFTEDSATEKINLWSASVAENIRNKNPQISETEDQIKLARSFALYSLSPSKKNTLSLMKSILNLPRDIISEAIINEAEKIIKSLQREFESNDPITLRLIRALRVSELAFKDDGSARAIDLLVKLENEVSKEELSLLKKAALWREGKPLSFITELKKLKEKLLYKYLPPPDFRIEKPREDVLKLVARVTELLQKKLTSTNKRDRILAEFLHELEDNPDGIRETIEEYNFVYAATTQQAAGKDIRISKNKNILDDQRRNIKYDTVVIDEAARTSPRDLLIPMAQAEKRIILVGDHRQLPHLIDEEVARALEGDDPSSPLVDRDFVKTSMFEYLFNRLKKLEEKDGITRRVTLDAQYRTHPLLGDFVSKNFYEKYKEAYKSPLAESFFEQSLEGIENRAAIWIDVPSSEGGEKRLSSGSRKRESEAQRIAEKLDIWLKSDAGKGLTFGVISFYKAQVFAVYEKLKSFGITEKVEDNTWQICQEYRFLENGEERLRIGTVDAFQGMEFDIVFLSMVRAQDMNALPHYINKEEDHKKKQQKLFGHLMSENRLCVSMSRQKKVLVMVGDAAFVQSQIAEEAVPALRNFYYLCQEQGVIL